jgi:hypothetical protein
MKTANPTMPANTIPKRRRGRKIFIFMLILAIIGAGAWWFFRSDDAPIIGQEPEKLVPSINGTMVTEDKAALRPLAVVIENSPEARPQSGLTDAELVYETVAEGGITRFLVVFQTRQPKEIGPVRSARPYFNTIANSWHAALVHVGGSKQALTELASGVHKYLYDINEFYFGEYFYRDKTRFAPHNLYTTEGQMRDLLADEQETTWQPISMWEFQNTPTDQLVPEVTKFTIPFSSKAFEVSYEYDPTTNSYKRLIATQPSLDRNNNLQVSPSNVIIFLTDISLNANDDLGTMNIKLTGTGPCYLFSAGKFKECRWTYENGKHIFTDTEGVPLKLQTGQTWIEIFPRNRQSQITWS